MKRELTTTPTERDHLAAWLETQGVHDRNPVTLDALIRLFRNLEKGGENNGVVQS